MKGHAIATVFGNRNRSTFTFTEPFAHSFLDDILCHYSEHSLCCHGVSAETLPSYAVGMCVLILERSDLAVPRTMCVKDVQEAFFSAVGSGDIKFRNELYFLSPFATQKIYGEIIEQLSDREMLITHRHGNVNRFFSARAGERLSFLCLTLEPIAGESINA